MEKKGDVHVSKGFVGEAVLIYCQTIIMYFSGRQMSSTASKMHTALAQQSPLQEFSLMKQVGMC